MKQFHALDAILRFKKFVRLTFEDANNDLSNVRFVVDHQNLCHEDSPRYRAMRTLDGDGVAMASQHTKPATLNIRHGYFWVKPTGVWIQAKRTALTYTRRWQVVLAGQNGKIPMLSDGGADEQGIPARGYQATFSSVRRSSAIAILSRPASLARYNAASAV
jgi:hypothetical protein